MNRLTNIVLLLTIVLNTNAQTKNSDFVNQTKKIVSDSTSEYFYPKLIAKMESHPSELSTTDCYYLYYGQIFQENHSPLFILNPERMKFEKSAHRGRCKKTIQIGLELQKKTPFDLNVLLHTSNCIRKKQYPDSLHIEKRFKNTLEAILSTGDGKSKETAIKIVSPEDDYVIKGVIGFLGGKEYLDFGNNTSYSVWEKNGVKLYFEDVMYESAPKRVFLFNIELF